LRGVTDDSGELSKALSYCLRAPASLPNVLISFTLILFKEKKFAPSLISVIQSALIPLYPEEKG
jgi:hypothetical protein